MGRPRIEEVDYHEFADQLRRATDNKGRIEKREKDRWAAYVQKHTVMEPSCFAYAKAYGNSAKPDAVIIDYGVEWDGYYVYSDDDMFALKFVPGDPPAAAAPAPAAESAAPEAPAADAPPEAPAEAPASEAEAPAEPAAEAPAEAPAPETPAEEAPSEESKPPE